LELTLNPLVAGSNPAGPTNHINGLGDSLRRSSFVA
jgi:hypothetical protein